MVYNELVVENVPQFVIQITNNNQRIEGWTTVAIISMATSMAFVVKGLFEPTWKICVLRHSISDAFSAFGGKVGTKPFLDRWVNAVISNPGIDELKAKKAAAIEDEDFDEAARLKDLIDSQVSLYSLIHALI